MEENKIYKLIAQKSNWALQLTYWFISALVMFLLFSNPEYNLQLRFVLVIFLITASYFTSLLINRYLVHRYLFEGKIFLFIYLLLAVLIIAFWIVSFSVILIIFYSSLRMPEMLVPTRLDIFILVIGNLLVVIIAVGIHFVMESYRKLLEKNRVEKEKDQTELKLKEAKLKLLQGQIHPHFLFNMLNNLYGLVSDNPQESKDTIIKLSELLDYMLYECDKPEVSLRKEIQFIENYIGLEKVRHDNNFNVQFQYPEISDDVQMTPLILFPFVENAFKHGFQDAENSFININLSIHNNQLEFLVENSINKSTEDKYLKQEGKGIGLKNIEERLELIYKNHYVLDILPHEGKHLIKLKLTIKNG